MFGCMLSHFSHFQLSVTPRAVALQSPLFHGDSPGKNTGVICVWVGSIYFNHDYCQK